MTEAEFWRVVEVTKQASSSFSEHARMLEESLKVQPVAELLAFQEIYLGLRDRAYTWDLWGAAFVIGEGCSDDGFNDFLGWLISLGKKRFERALKDPESLADIEFGPGLEEDCFFEEFCSVVHRSYEDAVGPGAELPSRPWPTKPAGVRWKDDAELERRFPRLIRIHGDPGTQCQ